MSCFSDTLRDTTTFKTPKTQVGFAQSQSVLYKMHHKTKNKCSQSRFSSTKVQKINYQGENKSKTYEKAYIFCAERQYLREKQLHDCKNKLQYNYMIVKIIRIHC